MSEKTFLNFLPEFEQPIRSGRKTMTCRNRRYGEAGDEILTPFGWVRFRRVLKVPVGFVADHLWRQEGCESRKHFLEIWARIHPRVEFDAETKVFLHEFELLTAWAETPAALEPQGLKQHG